MAQSSNYKQYNRTTRILTEESGFAGGMLWTGNNIDETHLKMIVNCDYDDTTSYLKARDAFESVAETPKNVGIQGMPFDLTGYKLLGVHTICAFELKDGCIGTEPLGDATIKIYSDAEMDGALARAGTLYLFTKTYATVQGVYECTFNKDSIIGVYYDGDGFHKCDIRVDDTVHLRNITPSNILINYENQLYGLGSSTLNPDAWIHVYRLLRTTTTEKADDGTEITKYGYRLRQYAYEDEKACDENYEKRIGYVVPKINSVSLLEACVSGFNAARGENTFTYKGVPVESTDQSYILGVYLTDADGNVIVSPRVGQTVTIHVPIAYAVEKEHPYHYLALFQLKESGTTANTTLEDSWQHIANIWTEDGTFTYDFKFQKKNTVLGFAYYGITQPTIVPTDGTSYTPAYSDSVIDYLMPYQITANDNNSNLKVKNYDLTTVNGSCIWKNRLCLWSTTSSNNCLFLSEVDNFYYYPVPHNVALFDANIVSCIPYKDTLLVFTANKVYRVFENNDGSFSQTVIQNDMPLSSESSAQLVAIKNMVLFKSGNYFYMIVPKSQSLTDELSIAPIYKNIAGFLNTLDSSVQEVLQLLYPEFMFTKCMVNGNAPVAVYSEQDTVHILYDVSATAASVGTTNYFQRTFKMFLNYNTNLRAWTLYFEETTDASLEVATLTEARLMSFVRILQQSNADTTAPFDIVTQQPIALPTNNFRILVDTGYRTLSAATQKRFREVQLKLYNQTESVTTFGTAFLVDGVWRRNYSKLQEVLIDKEGTGSPQVSLMPVLDLNTFVTELTMPIDDMGNVIKSPGSDAIELNSWELDFSHFKREAPITVRVPVSGKGYNPRFIFMTPNAAGLTINEINWVYRLMHGR